MKSGRLSVPLPPSATEEAVDVLVDSDHCRIECIGSRGHTSPEDFWYDQPWPEWVAVLKGSGTLRFADGRPDAVLAPGDWILIPAHCRHRVEKTAADEETIWLAVHYRE